MNPLIANASFDGWTGRWIRRLRRRYNAKCISIITYHSVSARESVFTDGTALRHHPADFERHVEYLAETFRPMLLRDLVAALKAGEQPERVVVITFDDGFADTLRCALPILRRRRVPMTVFPVAGVIGNADLMWQHKAAWLCANGHDERVRGAFVAAGLGSPGDGESVADFARRCFGPAVPEVLEDVLEDVGETGRRLAARLRPYIEAEDIEASDADLVEFGSHTLTHPVLSRLPLEAQRREIEDGGRIVQSFTGAEPCGFAYPFGLRPHYGAETTGLVRETGHAAALDMRRRINVEGVSAFDLSRKPAVHGSIQDFARSLEDWPDNAASPVVRSEAAV